MKIYVNHNIWHKFTLDYACVSVNLCLT